MLNVRPSLYIPESYLESVKARSSLRFVVGLVIRFLKWVYYSLIRMIAKLKGAKIGRNSIIPFKLAIKANSNLVVGHDCIIESADFDLRGEITVLENVIISKKVSIVRASHIIDDDVFFSSKVYPQLVICSYSWLATGCRVLPTVSVISYGSVLGASCVLSKDTEEMGVYIGNPAENKRRHSSVFSELVVPSLKGGDFEYYYNARH